MKILLFLAVLSVSGLFFGVSLVSAVTCECTVTAESTITGCTSGNINYPFTEIISFSLDDGKSIFDVVQEYKDLRYPRVCDNSVALERFLERGQQYRDELTEQTFTDTFVIDDIEHCTNYGRTGDDLDYLETICEVPEQPLLGPAPAPAPPGGYQPTPFSVPSAEAQELSQFQPGTSVPTIIGRIIKALLTVLGSVALLMFIYGGVIFMTSAGNAEKRKKAMQIMIWTALGVFAALASYIIVNFVFQSFG